MTRLLVSALLTLPLLAGCAVAPATDSPWYPPPPHSRLILEKPLQVPAVSIWIQDGRPVDGAPNSWRAACKFELWTRTEEPRTIAPDTFEVTAVARDVMEVSTSGPYRRASHDDGGPMAYIMRTVLRLRSDRQSDVYQLSCSRWDDPRWRRHLSIDEIRATLNGLFRLELPPAQEARHKVS